MVNNVRKEGWRKEREMRDDKESGRRKEKGNGNLSSGDEKR